jgi:RNA polymerase sigma factor (sigma-70 family)
VVDRAELNAAMKRLADGDRGAFDVVFDGVEPIARRVIASMLRRAPGDVDDAVQNTMTKLFAQSHAFDPNGDVVAWTLSLAFWESRTLLRRRTREAGRTIALSPSLSDDAPSPEDDALRAELLASLKALLGHVSDADTELLLRTRSGSPTDRKRKQRATGRLKALWRKYHGEY